MKILSPAGLRWSIRSEEIKPGMILIVSSLILSVHRQFGSVEFAVKNFKEVTSYDTAVFMFISAFVLMGLASIGIIKFIFRESVSEYGFSIGEWKRGLKYISFLYPLIAILLLYPSSNTKEMIEYYPLDKGAGESAFSFIRYESLRVLFFYTSWEIFFRGLMLFGLRRYVGDWMAICIQTIPSCLWHIGMPSGEIFSSIFGGIMFGAIAIRTKSILYPFILHILIGLTLDLLIVLQI